MWFEKADCDVPNIPEISFPDITIDYIIDDIYNGPYLICNSSSQGAHGSVSYCISDIAYKTEKLNELYNELHTSIQGFVDQANEWNSALKYGDPLIDTIDITRNESNRYMIVISSLSNVQNCYLGYGYGAEKVLGRYLVHIGFESCEKGDAAAYAYVMEMLEQTALGAIARVEGVTIGYLESQP